MIKRNEFIPITERGVRGEAVYRLKTAKTDITVDGIRDAAYDSGIHLGGIFVSDDEYYKDRPTNIDLYIARGKDGRLYFFGCVTDPDIFVKEEYFNGNVDECDSIKIFIDKTPFGIGSNNVSRIIPYHGEVPYNRMPADAKVVFTDKGFDFECSRDNDGEPFKEGDRIGFSVFYHDSNACPNGGYVPHLVKLPTSIDHLSPEFPTPLYACPKGNFYDTILFSELSADEEEIAPKTLTGNILSDILSGGATVAVICGGKCPAIQTLMSAIDVHTRLCELGVKSTFINNAAPDSCVSFDYEIVFNNYTLNGGNPLFNSLKCDEWGIELIGKSIFVSAPLEKSAAAAKERLLSIIDDAKNGNIPNAISERGKAETETVTEGIPAPRRFDVITDVGDGAYMYLTQNAEADDLSSYREKLIDNGFSLYTENSFGRVQTYTYVGHGAVITVVYSDNCKEDVPNSLRAVVEPMSKTTLPSLSPVAYEKVTSPKLTMMGFVGLCLVYKLPNGEFVILDGGCAHQYELLYNFLMSESDGKPVIAAWLFSHFHQDHAGVFVRLVETDEMLKNVKIKSVVYNFPQKMVSDTAKNGSDHANLRKWNSLLEKTGATVYQARTGQKYYLPGMEIELLWTFEDILPYTILGDDTNPTCTGYRVTVEDQVHMLLGDSSEEELRKAYKRIGSYLKSDLVQLAHHGMGSPRTPLELYKLIDAETVLTPGPEAKRASERWAADNAKRSYNAANGNVTLELPIK